MGWVPLDDADLVTLEFEFGFLNEVVQFAVLVMGRDELHVSPTQLRIVNYADEYATDEITIELSALAYKRVIKRVVTAESRRLQAWQAQTGIGIPN